MIEIIILIFLARKIGNLAERKGQPTGRWKLFLVLAWIGFEVVGITLSAIISGNLYMAMVFGLFCAFGGYLFIKSLLEKMPDKEGMDDWISNIGNEP